MHHLGEAQWARRFLKHTCRACRRFTHLKTLNGVQSVACFLWAALLLALPFNRRRKGDVYAPALSYWKPGISNSIGPALGSEALKNISYPAQVVFFSCPAALGSHTAGTVRPQDCMHQCDQEGSAHHSHSSELKRE